MEKQAPSDSYTLLESNEEKNLTGGYPSLPSPPSYSSFTSHLESDDGLSSTIYAYLESPKSRGKSSLAEEEWFIDKKNDNESMIIDSFTHTASSLPNIDIETSKPGKNSQLMKKQTSTRENYIQKCYSNKSIVLLMILSLGSVLGFSIYNLYFHHSEQKIIPAHSFMGVNLGLNFATIPLLKRQAAEIVISFNGIHNVKLFDYDIELMKNLISEYEKASASSSAPSSTPKKAGVTNSNRNEGLQIIVAIPNNEIKYLTDKNNNYINKFIDDVIKPYHHYIQYIALGNEPFNPFVKDDNATIARVANTFKTAYFNLMDGLDAYYGRENVVHTGPLASAFISNNLHSQRNIQGGTTSGNSEGSAPKVVIPFSMELLEYSSPPSNASFYPDIIKEMKDLFVDMNERAVPFFFNIYPYLTMLPSQNDEIDTSDNLYFALGHNEALIMEDGPYIYRSLFDASLDAIYVAMAKALDSYSSTPMSDYFSKQIQLVIGETGWPTKDGAFATSTLSCFYNKRMMQYVQSGIGTPRYSSNFHLDVFLFEAFDEMKKIGPSYEKNFGIYTESGIEKYPILSNSDTERGEINSFNGESHINCPAYCNGDNCALPVEEFCVANRNVTEDEILNAIRKLCPKYNDINIVDNSKDSLQERICPSFPIECLSNPYDYADLIFNVNYRYGIQYPERVIKPFNCDFQGRPDNNIANVDIIDISFLTTDVHGQLHSCSLK